jgi:hypothetical protein
MKIISLNALKSNFCGFSLFVEKYDQDFNQNVWEKLTGDDLKNQMVLCVNSIHDELEQNRLQEWKKLIYFSKLLYI